MVHSHSSCILAFAYFLASALPINCLSTNFPNSTIVTPTTISKSIVSSSLVTPGASNFSASVDPKITLAGSCGYIAASLGTPTTVIWQDTGSYYDLTGYVTESGWNTLVTYSFAQSRLPPPKCCASCSIQASRVQVRFWPPETVSAAAITSAPKVPYKLVSDGYTYTSPSVYVVYSGLFAQADCSLYAGGQIGNNISATTVAYAPDALSTAECYGEGDGGFNGWKTINYTDWAHPAPNSVAMTRSGCKPYGGASMTDDPAGTNLIASPQFSLPQGLSTLEPAWSNYDCIPWRYGALDPPRTLTKADAMLPTHATSATPAAQVSPPGSHITPVSSPADPKNSQSDPQSGTVPVLPVSEDPSPKSTPITQGSEPSKGDPTVTNSKPYSPSADSSTTAQIINDPPRDPSPTHHDQSPDPAHVTGANTPNTPQPALDPVLTVGSTTYQYHIDPSSNLVIASHTEKAGDPAISVAGGHIGRASSANSIVLDGTTVPITAPAPAGTPVSRLTIGDEVIATNSASQYIVQGQTLLPGATAITISGTPVSLGSSVTQVVVGSSTVPLISQSSPSPPAFTVDIQVVTANSASQYVVNDHTLTPGAAAITISGITISLASSAAHVLIGSKTVPLDSSASSHRPAITLGDQVITPDSSSNYVIHSQTLVAGAAAITVSGTPISLAPSASHVVMGSSTVPLQGGNPSAAPVFTMGNQVITADSASNYVVGGQTLIPGSQAVTVSGTPISLAPAASVVIVGSSTIPLIGSNSSTPSPIIVNGQMITANSASQSIIAGQTLTPGGPAISISGIPISIPASPQPSMTIGSQLYPVALDTAGNVIFASQTIVPGGSPVVVGGETISEIPNSSELVVAAGGNTTTQGLGQIIAGALGKTPAATGSNGASGAHTTGLTFTGEASRRWGVQSFSSAIGAAVMIACVTHFQ